MPHSNINCVNCGIRPGDEESLYLDREADRLGEISASLEAQIEGLLMASGTEPTNSEASLFHLAGNDPNLSLAFAKMQAQFLDGTQLHYYLDHPREDYSAALPNNMSYTTGVLNDFNIADMIFSSLPDTGSATAISGNVAVVTETTIELAGGQVFEILSATYAENGELLVVKAL